MPSYIRYHNNPKHHRQQRKESYQRNILRERRTAKERYYRRRELVILRRHEERVLDYSLKAELTPEQWRSIQEYYEHACAYCGAKATKESALQLEHVVPLSSGGRHAMGNVTLSCAGCNKRKGALPPLRWLAAEGIDETQFMDRLQECTRAWDAKEDVRLAQQNGKPEYDWESEVSGQCPVASKETAAVKE